VTEYLQWGEQALVVGSVVMVAVGILKAYIPTLKAGWTVLLAGILAYGLASLHAAEVCAGAKCAEQAVVVGTLAWGAALGVSWATRLSPTTTK
jgi:hypothetical protein